MLCNSLKSEIAKCFKDLGQALRNWEDAKAEVMYIIGRLSENTLPGAESVAPSVG